MAPPSDHPCLHIKCLDGAFFVAKLQPSELGSLFESVQAKDDGESFLSITRTDDELSVVGKLQEGTPARFRQFATWKAFKIAGPMEFELTGVLAGFVHPLGKAGVPVFALSTYNTDFILVPVEKYEEARKVLKDDNWIFVE
ncbi:ACT-7 domain-containing protein [Mycena kentingensis (nom. inval.)]|nr:ACT-7 domain-containing protein [Mycena kentingensis (nom. inval.)]